MKLLLLLLFISSQCMAYDTSEDRKDEYDYRVQQFRYQQILNRRPVHETYVKEIEMENAFKRRGTLPEEYPQYGYGE